MMRSLYGDRHNEVADVDLSRRALLGGSVVGVGGMLLGGTIPGSVALASTGSPGLPPNRAKAPTPPPLLEVEAVPFSHDDMGYSPTRWTHNGANASMVANFWWSYITGIPNRRPILFQRLLNAEGNPRLTFHSENASGMFNPPTQLTTPGMLHSGPLAHPYQKIKGDPSNVGGPNEWTYEASTAPGASPRMLYRAGTKGFHIIEGDVLDVRCEHMPLTVATSTSAGVFAPYFTHAGVFHGTYMGHEVSFMGGGDRVYGSGFGSDPRICFVFSGVHPNGRREWGSVYKVGAKSFGVYCQDGAAPVVSNNVRLEGLFVSDPADANRIAAQSLVFRFEGVELHWKAESTAVYPAPLNHFGPWHEARSSGQFSRSLGAVETTLTAANIGPLGFKISGPYRP